MNESDYKLLVDELIWCHTKNKSFTTIGIEVFAVRIISGYEDGDQDSDRIEYSTPILQRVNSIHQLENFTVQVMASQEGRAVFKLGTVPISDVCKSLSFADKFDHCKARLTLDELAELCAVLYKKSRTIKLMI